MTPPDWDLPGRLLVVAVRILPDRRHAWGTAMQAELATVDGTRQRWDFAWGCARASVAQHRPLRAALHLLTVLAVLAAVFAWAATIDYPPLLWGVDLVVAVLAGVCWQARRVAMLGPVGDSAAAWWLRGAGYLAAGAAVAVGLAHTRPTTGSAAERGSGLLVIAVVAASYLLGLSTAFARPSAATPRTLVTGLGAGLVAALAWLAIVLLAPPIPPSAGGALTIAGCAAVGATAVSTGRYGSRRHGLLAALLAATTALGLIFVTVGLLAGYGPDSLIPDLTPHALPADRISESRIEIVDPYVLALVLGALAAAALSVASVATRRPAPA